MTDLTEEFLQYRECARIVWTVFLRVCPDGETSFVYLETELFKAMVVENYTAYHGLLMDFIGTLGMSKASSLSRATQRFLAVSEFWSSPTKFAFTTSRREEGERRTYA